MTRLAGMRKIFSDLNLNGEVPVRVMPRLGEWQPVRVPTTKQKKMLRVKVGIAFAALVTALFVLGNYFYTILMGIS